MSAAISQIQKRRKVDLVIFGHMHNRLKRNLGLRDMFKVDSKGTIYLNTAVVPRYKTDEDGKLLINFSWIEFENKELRHVSHRWYSESGEIREEDKFF